MYLFIINIDFNLKLYLAKLKEVIINFFQNVFTTQKKSWNMKAFEYGQIVQYLYNRS